jgi:hypothetical protein
MRDLIEQLKADTARLETFRRRAERLHVEHRIAVEGLHGEIGRRDSVLAAAYRELGEIYAALEPR